MSWREVPKPLTEGKLCTACKGTGADIAATVKRPDWETGYVECRVCVGRGLDPAEYFRWGEHPKL